MNPIIDELEKPYMEKEVPDVNPGDTVKVFVRIVEGNKERIQAFEGTIIKKHGSGINKTITVRKVFQGVGVERVFLLHSPRIEKINVVRRGDVKRSKLYYLRERSGKATRIKEKIEKDKTHIHWYPGHIAKAERKLKEQLSLVDAVIEVIDARLPLSSIYKNITGLLGEKPRLILLNKADLADTAELKKWAKIIEDKFNAPVILSDAKNSRDLSIIVKKAVELSEPRIQALLKKGLLRRPARVMVVGMPNVGKSSIINKLTKSSKTKIGAKAGVTRQQQWVRINPQLELLDTPGIIPMRQDDQEAAKKLAFVNSISENAYTNEIIAHELLEILDRKYSAQLREYYGIGSEDLSVENIALKRNWIIAGGQADIERTSVYILRDFREGKIGKFILDDFEEQ